MQRGSSDSEPANADPKGSVPSEGLIHSLRETVETVVFVLLLVSLLRIFGAEAFVIPTGSMATTLLGAHKRITCPACGEATLVNASEEVELGRLVTSAVCQNCRLPLDATQISPSGGDRVLVSKFLYETIADPERWEVVVFKCPDTLKSRTNFIKRLIGRPGETVRIRAGDIFVKQPQENAFTIAAKPPRVVMATRRLVYDNDHLPLDLVARQFPARWESLQGAEWTPDETGRTFSSQADKTCSMVYRHRIGGGKRDGNDLPQLITDFEAYNGDFFGHRANWVGDLMLDVRLEAKDLTGSVSLELHEGSRRYRCVLDLGERKVTLYQGERQLAGNPSPIQRRGAWRVRFANVDDRLIVWVEDELVFGDGFVVKTPSADEAGPQEPDLEPVRITADKASVRLSRLRLFRDVYYTQTAQNSDYYVRYPSEHPAADLKDWQANLASSPGREFTVEPDSFLMLGDNSPCSSDSREWNHDGTRSHFVHRRLILGRAIFLYWPIVNGSSEGPTIHAKFVR